jgi:hypothetical protein
MVRVAAETETNIGGCLGRDPDHQGGSTEGPGALPVIAPYRHPDTGKRGERA